MRRLKTLLLMVIASIMLSSCDESFTDYSQKALVNKGVSVNDYNAPRDTLTVYINEYDIMYAFDENNVLKYKASDSLNGSSTVILTLFIFGVILGILLVMSFINR